MSNSFAQEAQPEQPQAGDKIDSHLIDLLDADARGEDLVTFARDQGMAVNSGKKVLVDVYFYSSLENAEGLLRNAGMDILASNDKDPFKIVEGWLPLNAIRPVANSPDIKTISPMMGGTGAVNSQGDAAHNGPQARALGGGITGAGVTVGVISSSMNLVAGGVADSQASGYLPANVNILKEGMPGGSDEGRAMAEIVYDMASGITNMLFESGDYGPTAKAQSIADLVNSGADIIVDDYSWLNEPFFQDGVVAQAVDAAVANGTAYIAHAGNYARQSYEAT
jgi:hypothetical protein